MDCHQNAARTKWSAGKTDEESHLIKLLANYYRLTKTTSFEENHSVHQYDIVIRERPLPEANSSNSTSVINQMFPPNDTLVGVRHAVQDGLKSFCASKLTQFTPFRGHIVIDLLVKLTIAPTGQVVNFIARVHLVELVVVRVIIIKIASPKKADLSNQRDLTLAILESILRFILGTRNTMTTGKQKKLLAPSNCINSRSPPEARFTVFISDHVSAVHLTKFGLVRNAQQQRELSFLPSSSLHLSRLKIWYRAERKLMLKASDTATSNQSEKVGEEEVVSEPDIHHADTSANHLNYNPLSFLGRVLFSLRRYSSRSQSSHGQQEVSLKWGVFCYDDTVSLEDLRRFVKRMTDRAAAIGFSLQRPDPVAIVPVEDARRLFNVFFNLKDRTEVDFVFVGIPRKCY